MRIKNDQSVLLLAQFDPELHIVFDTMMIALPDPGRMTRGRQSDTTGGPLVLLRLRLSLCLPPQSFYTHTLYLHDQSF